MPADRLAPSRSFSSSLRPIRKRVWTLGRFFVLVVLLGVTFAAFFLTAMRVTTRAREVKVPDVRGKSVNAATAALADEGLVLKIELTRPDASVPADHVFSQDPGPGTVLRRERAVRVRVSQGVSSPPLPALVGQPVRTAELTLSQAQIGIDNEAEIHTASYPADTVVAAGSAGEGSGDQGGAARQPRRRRRDVRHAGRHRDVGGAQRRDPPAPRFSGDRRRRSAVSRGCRRESS